MEKLVLHITFLEPVLGSLNNNINVFTEFTAAKAAPEKRPGEIAAVVGELTEAEAEKLTEEQIEKQTTVFPRDPKTKELFCYDYQWRGFVKEALAVGTELDEPVLKRLSKWTIRKTVDSMVFVTPRRIPFLNENGLPIVDTEVGMLERPLRAITMRGERVCLARSELVPAGTQVRFDLSWLVNHNAKSKQAVTSEALVWALDYGALKGFGQWRGGGYGRFAYSITPQDESEKKTDKKKAKALAEAA